MQWVGWVAAVLVFMSFFMKTIIPLRMLAIGGNIAFIAYALLGIHYGLLDKVLAILVLHLALLPLNVLRLHQIKRTIRQVREVTGAQQSLEFLIPYMTHEAAGEGQILFNKGAEADRLYLLKKGRIRLVEIGKSLGEGAVFGEVGVFAEHASRTSTALCEMDCELFSITGEKVIELFYQDPRFGFYIVRALSRYVSESADWVASYSKDSPEQESALAELIPAGAMK